MSKPTPLILHTDKKSQIRDCIGIVVLYFLLICIMISQCNRTSNAVEVQMVSSFAGKLKDIHQQRRYLYLTIENNLKHKLENGCNYHYQPRCLSEFLQIGDYVYKERCSDKIYIKRDGKTYDFNIGDRLYNSTHRSKKEVLKYYLTRRIVLQDKHCRISKE